MDTQQIAKTIQTRKVVPRAVDSLVPYARNANTHSDYQIKLIADSMERVGWTNPILIHPDGDIIAGHGRVMAAERLGLQHVPCIELDGVDKNDLRAYVLADNQLANLAHWDHEMLALELGELKALDVDLEPIGFDDKYVSKLLDTYKPATGATELSESDFESAPPRAQAGDRWELGNHVLHVADRDEIVAPSSDLLVFDPPFEIDDVYETIPSMGTHANLIIVGNRHHVPKIFTSMAKDTNATYKMDFVWDTMSGWYVGPNDPIIMHKNLFWWTVGKPHIDMDGYLKPWDDGTDITPSIKSSVMGGDDYTQFKNPRGKRMPSVFHYANTQLKMEIKHPHAKPLELLMFIVGNMCPPGGTVFDPFGGSGTTLIAAEKLGRECTMVEIEPTNADLIIHRWEKLTGETAVVAN